MRGQFLTNGFALLLAMVLILGVPALLLIILHLSGQESTVNGWLQNRLAITQRLSLPTWAALLLLLLPVFLLLLYFLKLKRKPLVVPSTYLWMKTIEDNQVNRLFQWLRRNWFLLLQLMILWCLIYALLALQLFGEVTTGRYYVLLLDNSASMSATDVSPSRLEIAKQRALAEIDRHEENDVGMVVVFNSKAEVLQGYTRNRSDLKRAVRRAQPTQRPTNLLWALKKAEGRANPARTTDDASVAPENQDPTKQRTNVPPEGKNIVVHLFSDGGFPDVSSFEMGRLNLRYHRIGAASTNFSNNVGIVSVSAQRSRRDPDQLTVFGRLQDYREQTAPVEVQLEVRIDNELRALRTTSVEPSQSKDDQSYRVGYFNFDVANVQRELNVVLRVSLVGLEDDFAIDNHATLIVGLVRRARVLLVSEGNRFLETFLQTEVERGRAKLDRLKPADLSDEKKYLQPAELGEWDLVIFDRCAPARREALPFANAYFVGSLPPPWKTEKMKVLKNPEIRGWKVDHPLMQELWGLQNLVISKAFEFDVQKYKETRGAPKLLEMKGEQALMVALPYGPFTHLVQTFPFVTEGDGWNCSWPWELSFPLFMENVLFTLGNVSRSTSIQPGETITIFPDESVPDIRVIAPDGTSNEIRKGNRPDFTYSRTELQGAYETWWKGKRQRYFAVNLLDEQESNLKPRAKFQVGTEEVQAGKIRQHPWDLWKYFVIGAVGLLFLEWYFYHRR